MDVHVRSKAPYLLEIIDHRSGGVGVARRCLGRIRKNVLHYRKLLPEAFVTKIRLYVYLIERIIYWSDVYSRTCTAKGSLVKSIKLNCRSLRVRVERRQFQNTLLDTRIEFSISYIFIEASSFLSIFTRFQTNDY